MFFSKIRSKFEGTVEEDAIDVDPGPAQPATIEELPAEPAEPAYCTLGDVETVSALPNSTEIENLMQQCKPAVAGKNKGLGHTDHKIHAWGKKRARLL